VRSIPARIHPAICDDSQTLTDLAIRAKAHWGYDAAFIEDCRAELTISAEYIRDFTVKVFEQGGRPVAFYSLKPWEGEVELAHLFVEPELIGGGIGKRLWNDAVGTARALGFATMVITSDPYAEGFYLSMGAERTGTEASAIRPGRELPLMRYNL
jgi:N-acetylglutamate synthase-like GNAT family acetyltransferase